MINTRSSFYYGHSITDNNNTFSFEESGVEKVATLTVGEYTLTSFATAVTAAMTTAGAQEYSVSIDRSGRLITIYAPSAFSLLVSTGSNRGAFSLMGFTGSDRTGTDAYQGDSASGSEYRPQFWLQNYISTDHYKEAVSASINESGSGDIQVISYGTRQFMECNIKFATNIDQGDSAPIETNLSGVDDLVDFMDNITGKTKFEFMADRDTPSDYESFLLESTPSDKNGIGYRLRELYGMKLPYYFETGTLKFRKITV